jgi:tRNA dimethylallyltransferase
VDDIVSRGKTAVIAGGTGLYMDALIKGNTFAPCPSTGCRERLEAQADEMGMEYMQNLLQSIDPEAAARIHDRKRLIRALEVYYETGETITAHNLKTQAIPPRYSPLWIGLDFEDREELYRRIDSRVDIMLEAGLIDEIKSLLARGIPAKCTAMQAIGYKEFIAALEGQMTIQEAAAQVQQSSRRYAKRQLTWFRRNENMNWIKRKAGQSPDEIFTLARQLAKDNDN